MLSIFAKTEHHSQLHEIINKEDRLEELVTVVDLLEKRPTSSADVLVIRNGEIGFTLDWVNTQPPFLLPETIALEESNLLGILFAKLNNYEKSYHYLQQSNPALFKELDFINRLQQGAAIDPNELSAQYSPFEEYRLMHNNAVIRHYAAAPEKFNVETTAYFYEEAMKSAPTDEHAAFTARQYALLLIDLAQAEGAARLLEEMKQQQLSEVAQIELSHTLCQAWLQQLTKPYDEQLLDKLKTTLWSVLEAYEQSERKVEPGLLLLDAAYIANILESFTEALGYITKAVQIFKAEKLEELAGNAHYRKGTLLYTWARKGNPQFYKPAIESYQEALKVFTKAVAPDVFADIHHNLGVLYTNLPAESKKKSIWASVAVSSFEEALSFYTKQQFPYQYGMICTSYADAFTKFPQAVLTDNYEKALFYYQEALDVRPADYPYERAITLLNYLEASWEVGNDPEQFNEQRYEDMLAKAQEVKQLVEDEDMLAAADEHLQLLAKLQLSELA